MTLNSVKTRLGYSSAYIQLQTTMVLTELLVVLSRRWRLTERFVKAADDCCNTIANTNHNGLLIYLTLLTYC